MIDKLETGKWYRWTGPKERPDYWNPQGEMDFMLDGRPHRCSYGEGSEGTFDDSPDPEREWSWGDPAFDYLEEVPIPKDVVNYKGENMKGKVMYKVVVNISFIEDDDEITWDMFVTSDVSTARKVAKRIAYDIYDAKEHDTDCFIEHGGGAVCFPGSDIYAFAVDIEASGLSL